MEEGRNTENTHHSQISALEPEAPEPCEPTWCSRAGQRIASKAPRLHSQIIRFVLYIRGPRPKVDLPSPIPFLNINFSNRSGSFELAIESTWMKATRRFVSTPLLFAFTIAYFISLAFLSRAQSFLTPASSWLSCTSTFWSPNAECGLNGQDCLPFLSTSYDLRCPAMCHGVILQNPRTVGNTQVVFKPFVVGGGDADHTYRGDSFICASALQAGVIANSRGGCISVQLINNFTSFVSHAAHGLSSLNFPTTFPIGFRLSSTTHLGQCTDLRNHALMFNILVSASLFLVMRPHPLILYWCLICIGFWHVSLFSHPRSFPPAIDVAFGAFLPTLFVAYVFWRSAIRFTLPAFKATPIEATVWYVGPFWLGLIADSTFNIPIGRLIASDIGKRSGSVGSFVVIIVVILLLTANQMRIMRKTGWLPYYLCWYTLCLTVILVISLLPGLQLRLHHYIIAMFFLPGTAFPTRLSAIYQGFLLGLFLEGVAAFGYDPIVQTAAALRRDAFLGSALPRFLTASSSFNSSIPLLNQTISWRAHNNRSEFSLLVDDVERYIGPAVNFSLAWLNASLPHFFRLAYVSDGIIGDFTMPAMLWPNGTWVDPLPGPS